MAGRCLPNQGLNLMLNFAWQLGIFIYFSINGLSYCIGPASSSLTNHYFKDFLFWSSSRCTFFFCIFFSLISSLSCHSSVYPSVIHLYGSHGAVGDATSALADDLRAWWLEEPSGILPAAEAARKSAEQSVLESLSEVSVEVSID